MQDSHNLKKNCTFARPYPMMAEYQEDIRRDTLIHYYQGIEANELV